MRLGRALLVSAVAGLALPAVPAAAQAPAADLGQAEIGAVCAPAMGAVPSPEPALRVIGAQDVVARNLFGPRDLLVVSGGTQTGVQLNQEYVIRRAYRWRGAPGDRPPVIETIGWLQIVAANDQTAVGLVEGICDAVMTGDYLEPFSRPSPIARQPGGLPPDTLDFSALGRVTFGSEERVLAGAGDYMLVDPGSAQLAAGRRVAVYRDHQMGLPLVAIGEGVIVAVTNGTPVMRIDSAQDAVRSGDYVVPRQQ
jgi:hypothetical protein